MNRFLAKIRCRIKIRMESYDEMALNRGKILTENCFNNVTANLVGGNFITGLLLYFHASTMQIGMLNIIIYICNTLQILSPLLLERLPKRKTFLIWSRVVIHFINVVLIGLIAVLPSTDQTKVILILAAQALLNLVSFTNSGFSIWHMKSVPEDKRAQFFSLNQITIYASIYFFLLLGSFVVDWFKAAGMELIGMMCLRGAAVVFAVLDILWLTKITEYPNEESDKKTDLKLIFTAPFQQKRYLVSVLVVFLWNFFANTTGSFYTVYLLKKVKVGYSFINLVGAIYVPCVLFLGPVWARYINRTSWFGAFYKALIAYGVFYLGQSFVTADWPWLYVIVILFCNLMSPAINIIMANMSFYHIPEKNQSVYLTFCTTLSMIGALLGNYYATTFMTLTEGVSFSFFGMPFQSAQVAVFVTGCLILVLGVIVFFLNRMENKNIGATSAKQLCDEKPEQ